MENILIPVDLSEDSRNAVHYAAALSRQYKAKRITLVYANYISIFEEVLFSPDFVQLNEDEIASKRRLIDAELLQLVKDVKPFISPDTEVDFFVSDEPLLRSIITGISRFNADLLVINSDSIDKTEESFVGLNAIRIGRASSVPVIVVPPRAVFRVVKSAVIAADLAHLPDHSIVPAVNNIFPQLPQNVLVLNIDPSEKHLNPDDKFTEAGKCLANMMEGLPYDIYYDTDSDIINGILKFTKQNQAQMIIALPRKYSFLRSLTEASITEGLAVNTTLPVLLLK
ncbi:hypothetical protein GCM10023149_09560 [Mucilaginibacter gynuensis]|uniref:UspA domain-containing protein n=1 Tax=Mucilaginibacter gynuensis TaxID=1302236 RepID=A0ABP8FYW2_9SPHI